MKNALETVRLSAKKMIESSESLKELDEIRVKILGKKGELTAILKQMGKLSAEERPVIGSLANEIRTEIENLLESAIQKEKSTQLESRLKSEKIDVTIPGTPPDLGRKHPLTIVLDELKELFLGLGYCIADGPEIEKCYYTFEALNIPADHPAREKSDTFYVGENEVLRSQTSTVQIRVMENQKPPIRIISPGRVYRPDASDATHSPVFHQIEGLVVDKGINMGHLKQTLEVIIKRLYGESAQMRLRPHHFPFTEPSCEVDVMCFSCNGSGCPLCKDEGYIEVLGAGMVHPNVLRTCNINPDIYSGFAFGIGLERIVMRRFNIDDIRLFFDNDLRFLRQF